MIGEVKDLTGRKYGRLTVIEQHGFSFQYKGEWYVMKIERREDD